MTRKQKLETLIEKIKTGKMEPVDLIILTPEQHALAQNAYNHDLNSAKAFHEAALQYWAIDRISWWPGQDAIVHLRGTHEKDGERWHNRLDGRAEAKGQTIARAWLIAILQALHAMEQDP